MYSRVHISWYQVVFIHVATMAYDLYPEILYTPPILAPSPVHTAVSTTRP